MTHAVCMYACMSDGGQSISGRCDVKTMQDNEVRSAVAGYTACQVRCASGKLNSLRVSP